MDLSLPVFQNPVLLPFLATGPAARLRRRLQPCSPPWPPRSRPSKPLLSPLALPTRPLLTGRQRAPPALPPPPPPGAEQDKGAVAAADPKSFYLQELERYRQVACESSANGDRPLVK